MPQTALRLRKDIEQIRAELNTEIEQVRAALRAGLGVGARTDRWLEPDLRILDRELPPLPDVELVLLTATSANELVVERLRTALRESLSLPARRTNEKRRA